MTTDDTRSPHWRPLLGARAVTRNTNQEARRASVLVWARGRTKKQLGAKKSK